MAGGEQHEFVTVAGHRMAFCQAGPADGPLVVLMHGLASDWSTWDRAVDAMAERGLRVIAVDLPGHGASDKPAGQYSLDDYARWLDEFFTTLGLGPATIGGHSLGGAIAVHFGYHYPQHVARLVLVSSGGLGREVHPLLRAAAVPGAERLASPLLGRSARRVLGSPRLHRALRLKPDQLTNLRRAGRSLGPRDSRAAFFASLRAVIEPAGQRGSFIEMRYLAEHVPTLVVWSERDGVIPVSHARATHDHLPGSRLLVFPGGGHEPHRRNAGEFADAVAEFVRTT